MKNAKGEYLSTLTAEYPPLLAEQIIQAVSHRVSRISGECRPLPLQGTPAFQAPQGPRLKMCDGAGNFSSADHSLPRTVEPHTSIAKAWLRWAAQSGLDKRIFAHVAQAKNEPPLTSIEVREAIGILFNTIQKPVPITLEPESQQPYRLHILRLLAAVTDDPDMALLHFICSMGPHRGDVPHTDEPSVATSHGAIRNGSLHAARSMRRKLESCHRPPNRGGSLDPKRDRQRLGAGSQHVSDRSPATLAHGHSRR